MEKTCYHEIIAEVSKKLAEKMISEEPIAKLNFIGI